MRITTVENCDRLDFEEDLNTELVASEEIGRTVTDVQITLLPMPDVVCYFAAIYFEPAVGVDQ